MNPTIDQIVEEIELSVVYGNHRSQLEEAANGIIKLFMPEYKPLSELVNSEENCKKIFNFVTDGYGDNKINNIEYRDDCVLIESRVASESSNEIFVRGLFIVFDGSIEHFIATENFDEDDFYYRNEEPIENIFELVDFIRNLGYSV